MLVSCREQLPNSLRHEKEVTSPPIGVLLPSRSLPALVVPACRVRGHDVGRRRETAHTRKTFFLLPRRTREDSTLRRDHCGQQARGVSLAKDGAHNEHTTQFRRDRHSRQRLAQRHHSLTHPARTDSLGVCTGTDGAQLEQFLQCHLHRRTRWRVRSATQEVARLAPQCESLQARARQVTTLHLRRGAPGCKVQLGPTVESEATAFADSPSTTHSLDRRTLRHPHSFQRAEASNWVVRHLAREARVNDDENIIDGDGTLGNVGAEDDFRLSLWWVLEDELLFLLGQSRMQWEHPEKLGVAIKVL
mmetsp:Transcript_2205/g.6264  ORF Transcript_2205/g.6264 Transcript_2205/m.6264 type:complete len:304 (-) Transcript_2205:2349-3260(-)